MHRSLNSLGLSDLHNIILFESCVTVDIVTRLEQYKDLYLPEPKRNWDEDEYKKRVYERAVVEELELLARLNPEMDIIDIICEFVEELTHPYNDPSTPDEVFEIIGTFIDTMEAITNWLD